MPYKLLVLDLDGTLTNSRKEITPHTLETLIQAQEQGIKIILASGRPTYGVAPIADKLRLADYGGYILSYNGSEIMNWANKEILYENRLKPELLPYLYACAKNYQFPIVTYHNEFVITEYPDDEYVQKEAILNVMRLQKVDNFLDAIRFPIVKCMIVGEPSRLVLLEQEMQERLKGQMGVYRSESYFPELVPDGIDKAKSLAVLLEKLSISREEVIACGDGFNDASMIRFAGLGVAMANAQPLVREQADYITLSNDCDGVAHVVEKFVFQRPF